MSRLESMLKAIDENKQVDRSGYCMKCSDLEALYTLYVNSPFKSITAAFDYGFTKGRRFQSAKKEKTV